MAERHLKHNYLIFEYTILIVYQTKHYRRNIIIKIIVKLNSHSSFVALKSYQILFSPGINQDKIQD